MPRRFEPVGDRMPKWEPVCRLRTLRPSVTHGWANPWQDEEEVLPWSKEELRVNIAVRLCFQSFLTHNKHHRFENKVWEIYIKKCIRSLLKSSLPVDYVSACKCIFVNVHVELYVAIQQTCLCCSKTYWTVTV